MTKQRHYDFGLRALKTLLVSAGGLKRKAIEGKEDFDLALEEKLALITGACNNILPKLVAEDVSTFSEILKDVFPGAEVSSMEDDALREHMVKMCEEEGLAACESFLQKMLQLNQVISSRHGIMVVGNSCVGKVSIIYCGYIIGLILSLHFLTQIVAYTFVKIIVDRTQCTPSKYGKG